MQATRSGLSIVDVLTGIVALAAVAVAVSVVHREFWPPNTAGTDTTTPTRTMKDDEWERMITGGNRLGSVDPAVTIVEFVDYQCPYCKRLEGAIESLLERHGSRLTVIYRDLPLESIHPVAYSAAKLARCARDQGSFPSVHKQLFAEQADLNINGLLSLASRAGVEDTATLSECMRTTERPEVIDNDIALARELELRGTPSIAINGTLYLRTPDGEMLEDIVTSYLKKN